MSDEYVRNDVTVLAKMVAACDGAQPIVAGPRVGSQAGDLVTTVVTRRVKGSFTLTRRRFTAPSSSLD